MNAPVTLLSDDEVARARDEHRDHPGSMTTPMGALPLRALSVSARVSGTLADVTVSQTFANTTTTPLEATYVFPLPPRAAVTRFRFVVDGRVVEGVLEERGAARRTYDAAIRAGHRAAIAEEERPDVFTMRVGNLPPGEEGKVELTLAYPLDVVDDEVTFRFPLVVAPRFIPGQALTGDDVGDGVSRDTDRVPDASRITPPVLLPGYPSRVALAIKVELDMPREGIRALSSSLHAVSAARDGDRAIVVDVVPGERLDRDFILRFALGAREVTSALSLVRDDAGDVSTFALTLVPPRDDERARRVPRDVVFVVDRSGSMQGWKIVAARRAVARMIDTLGARDRFAVLAFSNGVTSPETLSRDTLVDATDRQRFRAIEWVSKLAAHGGTVMHTPLDRACTLLDGGTLDRHRAIVFITDGQIGDEGALTELLMRRARGAHVFALGIDEAVNSGFLTRIANATGGRAELVESEDRLDDALDRLHRALVPPVVAELSFEGRGLIIDDDSVTPRRLPGLFPGVPVVVTGRCRADARGSIVVRGRHADGSAFEHTVDAEPSTSGAIATVWAKGRIRDLEDQYEVTNEPSLAARITALSLAHRVLCRFTAFVAVDRAEVVNRGGALLPVMQAVEPVRGWSSSSAAPERARRSEAPGAPAAPTRAAPVLSREAVAKDALFDDDAGLELEGGPPPSSGGAVPTPPMRAGRLVDRDTASAGDPPEPLFERARAKAAPIPAAPPRVDGASVVVPAGGDVLGALGRAPTTPALATLEQIARAARARLVMARPGTDDERLALGDVTQMLDAALVALRALQFDEAFVVAVVTLVELLRRIEKTTSDALVREVRAHVEAALDALASHRVPSPPPASLSARRADAFWRASR